MDLDLHMRYGQFVRDGPDSLLVSDIESFKSIYGFKGKLNKGDFYAITSNGKPEEPNLFSARTETAHKAVKKKLVSTAVYHNRFLAQSHDLTKSMCQFAPKHIAQYESSVTDNVEIFLRSLEQCVKAHRGTLNMVPSCERFLFDACKATASKPPIGVNS